MGRVPSGVAAVLFATIPLWMAVAQAAADGLTTVGPRAVAGILGGVGGVWFIVGPRAFGGGRVEGFDVTVVVLAAAAWAAGSSFARRWSVGSVTMATASYLLVGGAMLIVAAVASGEPASDPASITSRSIAALAYLVVCGSILAFGAYTWLLGQVSLVAVSTYAYVNPVVALLLGWLVVGEPLEARILVAAALVLSSVALILSGPAPKKSRRSP
jgi:drug/metabolite transporter (DMT)-like permease